MIKYGIFFALLKIFIFHLFPNRFKTNGFSMNMSFLRNYAVSVFFFYQYLVPDGTVQRLHLFSV